MRLAIVDANLEVGASERLQLLSLLSETFQIYQGTKTGLQA